MGTFVESKKKFSEKYDVVKMAVVGGGAVIAVVVVLPMLMSKRSMLKSTAEIYKMDLASRKQSADHWAKDIARNELWWDRYEKAFQANDKATEIADAAVGR